MKRIAIIVALAAIVAGLAAAAQPPMSDLLAAMEPSELSADERDSLLYMVEEEKLARDVYSMLYEMWGLRAFANISRSEQSHMDALGMLVDRYDLESPIKEDDGVFSNPELQSLYDELVATGTKDLQSAIAVGMTIEDLDIQDLLDAIAASDNDDIRVVYQNLLKGSRNHLRAFARQLSRTDGEYQPQYISDALYRRIVSTRNESGAETDPLEQF